MSNVLQTDDLNKKFDMFRTFTLKEMQKALRPAVRKAGNVIKKEAKKNLKKSVSGANRNPTYFSNGVKIVANDTLLDAIRVVVMKKTNKYSLDTESYVHTMGVKAKQSGTFITRFFEGGTKVRYIKTKDGKKKSIGKITATHFFTRAKASTASQVFSTMEETLSKTIEKINNSK